MKVSGHAFPMSSVQPAVLDCPHRFSEQHASPAKDIPKTGQKDFSQKATLPSAPVERVSTSPSALSKPNKDNPTAMPKPNIILPGFLLNSNGVLTGTQPSPKRDVPNGGTTPRLARSPEKSVLQFECRTPRYAHNAISLTSCGALYVIFGVLGTLLWVGLEESRRTSSVPMAVPVCGIIAGLAVIVGINMKERMPCCAISLLTVALLLHLFILIGSVMDTYAYFAAYSDLDEWDDHASLMAAAGSFSLLAAFFAVFVIGWLMNNLGFTKPKEGKETVYYETVAILSV